MTIRLISLDNHLLIHEGIRSLIAACDQIELVATGTTGAELLPLVAQHQPDIVLLELGIPRQQSSIAHTNSIQSMSYFDAFPTIVEIHKNYPATRVVILSRCLTINLVQCALKAGVQGYILKNDQSISELIPLIQMVYQGNVYFSQAVQNYLWQSGSQGGEASIMLTERQIEVLQVMAEYPDRLQKEHARRLRISENTLKQHLRDIYRLLEVSNLTAAVVRGLQLRLIPFAFVEPMRDRLPPPPRL